MFIHSASSVVVIVDLAYWVEVDGLSGAIDLVGCADLAMFFASGGIVN